MIAYHGKQEVKELYLSRVRAHRAADQLRQGFGYWDKDDEGEFRGCAVGCTLHSNDHSAYETELGIPRTLARLEDGIFEGLPMDRAQSWPEEFLSVIQVGADLSLVWPHFAIWLMSDEMWGVRQYSKSYQLGWSENGVVDLYNRKIIGDTPHRGEWKAAASSVYEVSASAYAVDSSEATESADYADSAYAYAAYAGYAPDAETYVYKAAEAAIFAAASHPAARNQARIAQADKLLELMAAAPVVEVLA